MGFNKRFFSEDSIRLKAKHNNYRDFFYYFKVDGAICQDKFSQNILERINKLKITNEEEINKIIKECK